jgi:hypothetical protein
MNEWSSEQVYLPFTGEATMETVSSHPSESIRIKRDPGLHAWAIEIGGRWKELPWAETADAVCVVFWVKERMGWAVRVKVEL